MTSTNALSCVLLFVLFPMTCAGQINGSSGGADSYTGMSHFPGGCLWETYCCERESVCESYYRSLSLLNELTNFRGPIHCARCSHTAAQGCRCAGHGAYAGSTAHVATDVTPNTSVIANPRPPAAVRHEPELAPRVSIDTSVAEPADTETFSDTLPTEPNEPPLPAQVPNVELPRNEVELPRNEVELPRNTLDVPQNSLPTLPKNELPTTRHRQFVPIQHVGMLYKTTTGGGASTARGMDAPKINNKLDRNQTPLRSLGRWRTQSVSSK